MLVGFKVFLTLPKVYHVCKNLQSALKAPEIVDKLLAKEVEKGFMIGPYDSPPFSKFRIKSYSHSNTEIFREKAPDHRLVSPS